METVILIFFAIIGGILYGYYMKKWSPKEILSEFWKLNVVILLIISVPYFLTGKIQLIAAISFILLYALFYFFAVLTWTLKGQHTSLIKPQN